jgi:mycothiol system anti-sigma-R factor
MKEYCRETLQQAFLYIDEEVLSAEQREEIKHHLEECAPCLERYGMEREVTYLIHRLKDQHHCPDRLRAKITGLIEEI